MRLRTSSRQTFQSSTRNGLIDAIHQWGMQSAPLARGAADHRIAQIASELAVHAREKLTLTRREILKAAAAKFELSFEKIMSRMSRIETGLKAFAGIPR